MSNNGKEEEIVASHRTPIAERLQQLRDAAFHAAESREPLPQRLFWSLFLGEVKTLKEKKQRADLLAELL